MSLLTLKNMPVLAFLGINRVDFIHSEIQVEPCVVIEQIITSASFFYFSIIQNLNNYLSKNYILHNRNDIFFSYPVRKLKTRLLLKGIWIFV